MLDPRSVVDLTDELLATEQEMPRWLVAAWTDALARTPPSDPDREPAR